MDPIPVFSALSAALEASGEGKGGGKLFSSPKAKLASRKKDFVFLFGTN